MDTISIQRQVPVVRECDVLVAGGGPAGVAAAVACARCGASVILVEQNGMLGGMGTAGLVNVFVSMTDGEHVLMGGVGREIVEQLKAMDATNIFDTPDNWDMLPFDGEILKEIYDDITEKSGVETWLYTKLTAAETAGGRITSVVFCAPEGLVAVRAKIYIDTTGDAVLSVMAGVPCELGDEKGETQAPTLVARYTGIDFDRFYAMLERTGETYEMQEFVRRAYEAGDLSYREYHVPGAIRVGDHTAVANIGHVYGADCSTARGLTDATVRGRRIAREFYRFFKKYIEGFEACDLVATGSMLGIRETRRVRGEYRLGVDDFLARRSFPDDIGRYNYAVDVHQSVSDPEAFRRFSQEFNVDFKYGKGESYGIPYRCLLPVGVDNLLTAGRCLSADRQMQGSTRVMPCCFITGQAAGTAAALSVRTGVELRELDIPLLQKTLREAGAYLPDEAGGGA